MAAYVFVLPCYCVTELVWLGCGSASYWVHVCHVWVGTAVWVKDGKGMGAREET